MRKMMITKEARLYEAESAQRVLQREANSLRELISQLTADIQIITKRVEELEKPVPMLLWCPLCRFRHVDKGEWATRIHKSHACQNPTCGMVWRPAIRPTVGVQHLPGFKDEY